MLYLGKQTLSVGLQRCGCGSVRQASVLASEPRPPPISFKNEPVYTYKKGSVERDTLERSLKEMLGGCQVADIPLIIGGEEIRDGCAETRTQYMPHDHKRPLATYRWASKEQVKAACDAATEAQRKWDRDVPLSERIRTWMKAADLMATKYRGVLCASTMLGQGKTVVQAEIDAAAELIDFFRWSAHTIADASKYNPISTEPNVTLNSMRLRGLEGFVAAVSPFNFTAIGGNLAFTPTLAGCSVVWKPSDTAILSNWLIWKACVEAGVPRDVVNFVPAEGPVFGDTITNHPELAAINFTGSVPTFRRLWKQVGEGINKYRHFPKLVGECGGKNYHLVHKSADVKTVVACTIRSAFEYQGQKCSACSRIYVPKSLWPQIKQGLIEEQKKLKMGPPTDFSVFMTAVIDETAFKRISSYLDHAKKNLKIIAGGKADQSKGYFVEPTIVQVEDPHDKIMVEEIFGPVLSCYVYDDSISDSKLFDLVDNSTSYALTGAIFAKDTKWLSQAFNTLRCSAGNIYLNDKSTGSVVAQQPFGGARLSGTNDKAGGPHYVLKWTSPQSVKETFVPMLDIGYPYMKE